MNSESFRAVFLAFVTAFFALPAAHAQSLLTRLGDSQDLAVREIAAVNLDDQRLVTVAVDAAGALKLVSWNVTADGRFSRLGDTAAGKTNIIAAAALGAASLVTAVRQENGALRLIAWNVSAAGKITRAGSADAGPVEGISIARAGVGRVVTATGSQGQTKLIVWDVDNAGQFTRRGDSGATAPAGQQVAIAALSATQLVGATRTASGQIDLRVWALDATGNLVSKGSIAGPTGTNVRIVNTALDRAVTACRRADGSLHLDAWNVDLASGAIQSGGSASAGMADAIELAALGSTKVVTALRLPDKSLKLITWRVVDGIERLDDISAGSVGAIGLSTLGWDRMVTAVQTGGDTLKLIDWADFSVGMLHASWAPPGVTGASPTPGPGPIGGTSASPIGGPKAVEPENEVEDEEGVLAQPRLKPVQPSKKEIVPLKKTTTPQWHVPEPPAPNKPLVFVTDLRRGVDPMIAAGEKFLVVTEDHEIQFYQKQGNNPPLAVPIAGKNTISSSAFFANLTAYKKSDGSVNRNNINLHLRFQPDIAAANSCDPATPGDMPCIDEFYDTRVTYDAYNKRFVIVSAARKSNPGTSISSNPSNPTQLVARRYVAIAVSKTEDPRDGFQQYITTESNYSDWPRVAVGAGVLTVAHNACKGPDDSDPCQTKARGIPTNVPMNAMALRPMAYVYKLADLESGAGSPRNWKIYPYQTGGGTFYPVVNHGDTAGWTYFAHALDELDFFGLVQPDSAWGTLPALKQSGAVALTNPMEGFRESVHYQSGAIYFSGAVNVAARQANVQPGQWRARAVRIPLATVNGGLQAGSCPAKCLVYFLGSPNDTPKDETWSYEMTSMVPNKAGDMFLLFGRVPVTMPATAAGNAKTQQVRYAMYYAKAQALTASQMLRAGDLLLQDVDQTDGETQLVTENYWHLWLATATTPDQRDWLDYATAVADPDGKSFWFAHAYPDSATTRLKLVAGRVAPGPSPAIPETNRCTCPDGFMAGPTVMEGTPACVHICMGHGG